MTVPPGHAMVLAAGLGRRMRPLTDAVPKPMVAVAGRTLIDRVLDRLAAAGVGHAVVNLHHRADRLQAHLAGRAAPPRIAFSDERAALLDTGGGCARALPLLGSGPFYAINSDALWQDGEGDTLLGLADFWDPARMDALLLLVRRETALAFDGPGDFFAEESGRLARRGDRPAAPYVFGGVQILAPALFRAAPTGPFSLNLIYDRAIAHGRLFGLVHDGLWVHVGTPEAIAVAEAALRP